MDYQVRETRKIDYKYGYRLGRQKEKNDKKEVVKETVAAIYSICRASLIRAWLSDHQRGRGSKPLPLMKTPKCALLRTRICVWIGWFFVVGCP